MVHFWLQFLCLLKNMKKKNDLGKIKGDAMKSYLKLSSHHQLHVTFLFLWQKYDTPALSVPDSIKSAKAASIIWACT